MYFGVPVHFSCYFAAKRVYVIKRCSTKTCRAEWNKRRKIINSFLCALTHTCTHSLMIHAHIRNCYFHVKLVVTVDVCVCIANSNKMSSHLVNHFSIENNRDKHIHNALVKKKYNCILYRRHLWPDQPATWLAHREKASERERERGQCQQQQQQLSK